MTYTNTPITQTPQYYCCQNETLKRLGMPPHPYQYIRSCCNVQVENIRRDEALLRMRRRDLRRLYG